LQLRLTPTGAKAWVLLCRDPLGRLRRFPLGDYPTISISDAREKAREMRQAVRHDGADPIAEGRRKRAMGKAALAGEGTLKALLDEYGRPKDADRPAGPGAALKSWTESRKRVEVVFKAMLGKPLGVLTLGDMQMTANRYPSAMSAAFAVRTLRPALKWAAEPGRSYVPSDLGNLRPPVGVTRRKRVLPREELARVLPALRASKRPYAKAMLLMLLTLTRREEAAAARWRDINLTAATWTIRETKNGEPHIVPLSRQALALLRAMPRGKPDALVFSTSTGGALTKWDRETKAIHEASKTEGWHRHDLRRTGATMLGEMGELPDIVEAALNHVSIRSALAATYNRSRYRPQVAAALQRLADALDGIEKGSGEVVQLHRA
jgi:integrase